MHSDVTMIGRYTRRGEESVMSVSFPFTILRWIQIIFHSSAIFGTEHLLTVGYC